MPVPVIPTPPDEAVPVLDLRRTKCPLNFVRARLALEKLPSGARLEIRLATGGDSSINVPRSLAQEGHAVLTQSIEGDVERLLVRRSP